MYKHIIAQISRQNGYKADALRFFLGDVVLMKTGTDPWQPVVYFGYDPDPVDPMMFRSGENWHDSVAPVEFNEHLIGQTGEAKGQITREWMENKGYVNEMFHELGGACEHVGKLTHEEVERLK